MVNKALDRILRYVMGRTDTEYMAWTGFNEAIVTEDEVGIVQFKDECLKEGTVVHLRTQEQADTFSVWLDSEGMRWDSGSSYLDYNAWYRHKEDTGYKPHKGSYATIEYYAEAGCDILSYEEALLNQPPSMEKINKEITKEVEAIKALPTDVLIVMLYNHVYSEEQLLEGFFQQVEDELKFRLDDYSDLCISITEDTIEEWIKDNVTRKV